MQAQGRSYFSPSAVGGSETTASVDSLLSNPLALYLSLGSPEVIKIK